MIASYLPFLLSFREFKFFRLSIPNKEIEIQSSIDPYRIWLRYQINKWEFRAGLQKIDFGVAQLLRPIQWFNQIDQGIL